MKGARFEVTGPVIPLRDLGAVHVLAIGGAGMSALARLFLDAGVQVSGSDANDSPLLHALAQRGATVHVGHDPAYLQGADTVVVSSAIREDNPELMAARAAGLRILHRSQALASLMQARTRVAVAGANGKTTTTSMLTVALIEAGADPSFAIGGELAELGVNARLGAGEPFVVEADESDGSFLAYRPQVAIVTNVQPDHLDFYGTFAAVQAAYGQFVASIPAGGLLVACADDSGSAALAESARRAGTRVVTYGRAAGADLVVGPASFSGLSGSASLTRAGAPARELSVSLPGEHNLLNGAAAFLAATDGLGLDADAVLQGIAAYSGTRRRFEPKGEVAGVRVVDDYAHNPAKVAAVVSAGGHVAAPGRLVVCFQPHLYSRTRDFAAEFGAALRGADVVVVLDIYGAREDPVPGVSSHLISQAAREAGVPEVHDVVGLGQAATRLAELARQGDLVLTVGAGDVTRVGPELLSRLAQAHG
ncbi:UDP-N-acetylmuramate--L-alanine ligase [Gephyromycinifex aptenodytis]|uniref:UDP-N-acetylmuramate--L-alanine ligase n=1 Tax=Gephyromycinifex aptenodytis TaxID=2716227 RepID=UPI0014459EB7|nr:UDP-N-acetylmuramate--L-alanine ligase [Gephyromycinifex aptenodytis]